MFDYAARRGRFEELVDETGIELVFLPPSADLEYLTGMQRRIVTFGEIAYAHHWVAGAFFAPGREPLFVLPRMIAEFDLPSGIPGDVLIVTELDEAEALFAQAVSRFGPVRSLGIGARTWGESVMHLLEALDGPELVNAGALTNRLRRVKSAEELGCLAQACRIVDRAMAAVSDKVVPGVTERELAEEVNHQIVKQGSPTVSFDTGVFVIGPGDERDANVRVSERPIREGTGVSFDFGAIVDGYCSDFGRTIHAGKPNDEFRRAYAAVIQGQAAGIAAVRPGVTAAEVHAATRAPIVDAGYGDWFRHRTGHCIGLDVHERPFISEEEEVELEPGMTFTIEPSIFRPGHVGARIEDIIVCEQAGGRKLNEYPEELVANA